MPSGINSLDIYPSSDARCAMLVNASWSTTRGDESTNSASFDSVAATGAIGPSHTTGRGGGYANSRLVLPFVLSGVPIGATVTSVKLFLKATLTSTNKMIPLKSTSTGSLGNADYGSAFSVLNTETGDYEMEEYKEATAISTSGTTMTLNSTAISDVQSNIAQSDNFKIIIVGERDFTNTQPASNTDYAVSLYRVAQSGTSSDPKLTVEYTTDDNALFFGANF
tara:strand:+ start:2558 stop:3226 length:669 start_codon:yes stop_codon:yes gene_type:complete